MTIKLLVAALTFALGACAAENRELEGNEAVSNQANGSGNADIAPRITNDTESSEPPPAPPPPTNVQAAPPQSEEPAPATEDEYIQHNRAEPQGR